MNLDDWLKRRPVNREEVDRIKLQYLQDTEIQQHVADARRAIASGKVRRLDRRKR
jgi:hypothetical protein